eukprot:11763349-Alexandrium_andersonii.AAC.1
MPGSCFFASAASELFLRPTCVQFAWIAPPWTRRKGEPPPTAPPGVRAKGDVLGTGGIPFVGAATGGADEE